jgi:hypothetical protein
MVDAPTVSEVEAQYGPTDIPTGEAQELCQQAANMVDELDQDQVLFLSELQGDEKNFAILLVCHKWALREGEPQSESRD